MSYDYPGIVRADIADWQPGYGPFDDTGAMNATIDPDGQQRTRSAILTDEGGYTVNYGGALAIDIGTCVFNNTNNIVTGTGFGVTYPIKRGDYVKASVDGDSSYVQINTFTTTTLYLEDVYPGTSGTYTGNSVVEQPKAGTGTSVALSGGVCVLSAGSTSDVVVELERLVDYYPIVMEREFAINQRVANQTIYCGFYDDVHPTPLHWAWFKFSGTDASLVTCESANSRFGTPAGNDIQSTVVQLPAGIKTSQYLVYRIEVDQNEIRFLANDSVLTRNNRAIFGPGDVVTSTLQIVNGTSPTAGTTVSVRYSRSYNYNKVAVGLSDTDKILFSNEVPAEGVSAIPVRVAPLKTWRTTFSKVLSNSVDTSFFTLLQTGSGQSINQASGNLVITTGTTANAETVIRSKANWTDSYIMRYQTILSQRIINQNFIVEMVDIVGDGLSYTINSATSVTVTVPGSIFTAENVGHGLTIGVITGAAGIPMRGTIASTTLTTVTLTVAGWPASGSGTCSLFGWNYHQFIYSGTTATNESYDAQRRGWNSGATTLTINTTATAGHLCQLYNDDNVALVSDALVASGTGYAMTQRGSRVVNLPSNDAEMYIQIRCLNGTTNPVSTTTWTIGTVGVEEFAPVSVDIHSAKQVGTGAGLQVAGAVTVTGSATTTAAAATVMMGDVGAGIRATTTNSHVLGTGSKHFVAANTTNATVLKGSAGRLYGWALTNNTAAWVYVKFHNASTTPTAGSGVVQSVGIAPNGTNNFYNTVGVFYGTGISVTTVTEYDDAGTTAVAIGSIVGEFYLG
jgi:hypothetical protein